MDPIAARVSSVRADAVGPRTARAAGIAGLVFAGLFTTAFALIRVDAPPIGAVPFQAWLAASHDRISAGTFLIPFSGIAFIWFVAAVRRRIGHAEGLFFATAFIGSALVFVAMTFAAGAAAGSILAAAALEDDAQREAVAAVGHALGYALFFGFAVKMAAMFMLAVASIGRSSDALPRWLGAPDDRPRRHVARGQHLPGADRPGVPGLGRRRQPAADPVRPARLTGRRHLTAFSRTERTDA